MTAPAVQAPAADPGFAAWIETGDLRHLQEHHGPPDALPQKRATPPRTGGGAARADKESDAGTMAGRPAAVNTLERMGA